MISALFRSNSTSPSLLCGDCHCVGSGVTLQEQPFEKAGSYTEVVFEERQLSQGRVEAEPLMREKPWFMHSKCTYPLNSSQFFAQSTLWQFYFPNAQV